MTLLTRLWRRALSRPWWLPSRLPASWTHSKGPGRSRFSHRRDAFGKLPASAVADLLKPENKAKLQAVLTYHVVAGKVLAADVLKLKSAKSVQGQDLAIDTSAGVKVDGATVVQTDIVCTNGVIHIIDSLLLPK